MKTNLDKFFKTNSDLEKSGIWFEISDTTGFLLNRFGGMNSDKVKAMMAKYYKPYARQIENGTMDPKKEKEIMVKVFVESSVLDWKGVEIEGVDTPFSKETAVEFFVELPELAEALMSHAMDFKNYKEDLGNS